MENKFNRTIFQAKTLILLVFIIGFSSGINILNAQIKKNQLAGGDSINTITTAVPFLLIAPDARSGSMGDVGVAIRPDANSMHWNPAKLAFINKNAGFALTHTPWLRQLVKDISLSYLSGYWKMSKVEGVGLSLLYFSLGDIQFTDEQGNSRGNFRPMEYAFSGAYARKLSEDLSIGFDMKYVLSDLASGQFVGGKEVNAGQTVAGGFSVYYNRDFSIKETKNNFAFGLDVSNIGAKITYTNSDERDFIPGNLRAGFAFEHHLDEYNVLLITMDGNKLLVPTPPILGKDSTGKEYIIAGTDDNKPLLDGIFSSFNDAPGGSNEEWREINFSYGLEYWYDKLLAVRAGYFFEHPTKGNRQYYSLGLGLRYNVFGLDFSYLVPTEQQHPLAETLRFTLSFDFEGEVDPKEAERDN